MGRYAANTSVSVGKSKEDIENTLRRYKAKNFGSFERDEEGYAAVCFDVSEMTVLLKVPLPSREDFDTTSTGRERNESSAAKAYEQEVRQRWRALLLAIKAKLEAVETGISTLEQEFLAFFIVKGGQTLGEVLIPQLPQVTAGGNVNRMLALPAAAGANGKVSP